MAVVVSVINASSTLIVNPSLSVTNFIAKTGSFTTKVSGVAAEFSGNVSVNNLFAATNIFIGGSEIPDASFRTSINAVIASISTCIAGNTAAITSVNTSVVAITAAITSVNTVVTGNTTNITANTAAITSVNTSVVS